MVDFNGPRIHIGTFSIKGLVITTWVHGLWWCLLPVLTQNKYEYLDTNSTCAFDFLEQDRTTSIVVTITFTFTFVVPVLTMIMFYTAILVYVRGNYSRLNATCKVNFSAVGSSSATLGRPHVEIEIFTSNKPKLLMSLEFRIIRSSIITIGVFCFSWLPYFLILLLVQFSTDKINYVTPNTIRLVILAAKSSSILNPLVYGFTNKDFLRYMGFSWFTNRFKRH